MKTGFQEMEKLNPNPVTLLLKQSKTGRKYRTSGQACYQYKAFTGLGLSGYVMII